MTSQADDDDFSHRPPPTTPGAGARRVPLRRARIDPLLTELRAADARYHRLCSDLQRVDVPASELRLDDLAAAVARLGAAVDRLRRRP